jgi:hypothetical protein
MHLLEQYNILINKNLSILINKHKKTELTNVGCWVISFGDQQIIKQRVNKEQKFPGM